MRDHSDVVTPGGAVLGSALARFLTAGQTVQRAYRPGDAQDSANREPRVLACPAQGAPARDDHFRFLPMDRSGELAGGGRQGNPAPDCAEACRTRQASPVVQMIS
jgi:hypothetical protein